ncbi:MAG: NAD(P)H-quinone oxidoreductase subunit 3 [Pseudomonadota bacterium]
MTNLDQYIPILLFILVGVAVGILPQVLGYILGPNRPDAAKNSPYECGFEAFEDARMKFDVRYYLVAILFILFDLEIACGCGWFCCGCHFSRHSGCGLCLRVEKRRPGLGMIQFDFVLQQGCKQ